MDGVCRDEGEWVGHERKKKEDESERGGHINWIVRCSM